MSNQDIENFNANPNIKMQEKITLYLCGLGALARELMMETNATNFETTTTLEPKYDGMAVDVKVIVKKSKK